jgi:hypothetical protein
MVQHSGRASADESKKVLVRWRVTVVSEFQQQFLLFQLLLAIVICGERGRH